MAIEKNILAIWAFTELSVRISSVACYTKKPTLSNGNGKIPQESQRKDCLKRWPIKVPINQVPCEFIKLDPFGKYDVLCGCGLFDMIVPRRTRIHSQEEYRRLFHDVIHKYEFRNNGLNGIQVCVVEIN